MLVIDEEKGMMHEEFPILREPITRYVYVDVSFSCGLRITAIKWIFVFCPHWLILRVMEDKGMIMKRRQFLLGSALLAVGGAAVAAENDTVEPELPMVDNYEIKVVLI